MIMVRLFLNYTVTEHETRTTIINLTRNKQCNGSTQPFQLPNACISASGMKSNNSFLGYDYFLIQ